MKTAQKYVFFTEDEGVARMFENGDDEDGVGSEDEDEDGVGSEDDDEDGVGSEEGRKEERGNELHLGQNREKGGGDASGNAGRLSTLVGGVLAMAVCAATGSIRRVM